MTFERNTPIRIDKALAWALNNIRVKWDVMVGVLCRNQQGENYARYATFQAVEECLSLDISELVENACAQMFEDAPKLQRLCPFWVAVPRSKEKDDITDLFVKLRITAHRFKVFNRIATEFELNCNISFKDYHTGNWFDIPFDAVEVDLAI